MILRVRAFEIDLLPNLLRSCVCLRFSSRNDVIINFLEFIFFSPEFDVRNRACAAWQAILQPVLSVA